MKARLCARASSSLSATAPRRTPELFQHLLHVVGQRLFEVHGLAGRGMLEAELASVQHQARRRQQRALVAARVDPIADDGMASLGEVNADLMRAAGFEAALDEACTLQAFEHLDVGDGFPAELAALGRAAQTVAAILDQACLEALLGRR